MKALFKIYCYSAGVLFLAWIAKMQFIFGGDYLFRIGSAGFIAALLIQIIRIKKDATLQENKLTRLFLINSISLLIVYSGMMMKVAHIMNTQLEKDIVLDFIGIPIIITSVIYSFARIELILSATTESKLHLYRNILFPWILFLFSFLLYTLYSVILART